MLLPALSRARDTAKNASCINNLKQLGVAGFSYIDDNNGWHMTGKGVEHYLFTKTSTVAPGSMGEYVQCDPNDNMVVPKILSCPISGRYPPSLGASPNPNFSYTFNKTFLGFIDNNPSASVMPKETIGKVKNPSGRLFAGAVGYDGVYVNTTYNGYQLIQKNRMGFRHRKQTNMTFVDGHTGSPQYEEIPNYASPTSGDDVKMFWTQIY